MSSMNVRLGNVWVCEEHLLVTRSYRQVALLTVLFALSRSNFHLISAGLYEYSRLHRPLRRSHWTHY